MYECSCSMRVPLSNLSQAQTVFVMDTNRSSDLNLFFFFLKKKKGGGGSSLLMVFSLGKGSHSLE
jgi:hypothetical protein